MHLACACLFAHGVAPLLRQSVVAGRALSAMRPTWGVSPTTVGRLRACGAPFALLLIVKYVASLSADGIVRDLDCVEFFSGGPSGSQLTAAFKEASLAAVG